jgi:hypothetical protein
MLRAMNTTTRTPLPILRGQRQAALASFEHALALNCGVVRPRYLPLAESVQVYSRLVSGMAAQHASGRLPRPLMAELLRRAQESIEPEPCLVFLYNSCFAGGIEMALPTFWTKALDLLDFDGDAVFAVARDGSQGLMLDFDPSPLGWCSGHDGSVELFAWGTDWPRRVPSFGESFTSAA